MPSILLVEDDESFGYMLGLELERAGYNVIPATSSMKALDLLESVTPLHLLLSDIVMPSGQPNGFALGRMSKMKRLGMPVLFMTGYDLDAIAIETTVGRVFRKPFDVQTLIAEIAAQITAARSAMRESPRRSS